MEKGRAEQRERRSDHRSHKVVARHHGRRIAGIAVGEVAEARLEQHVGGSSEEGGGDDGHYPVHAGLACPAEPEEGDWKDERGDHGDREAHLRYEG